MRHNGLGDGLGVLTQRILGHIRFNVAGVEMRQLKIYVSIKIESNIQSNYT